MPPPTEWPGDNGDDQGEEGEKEPWEEGEKEAWEEDDVPDRQSGEESETY